MTAPEMLSIGDLSLEAELWPLIGGRLVIDQLTVTNASLTLEVNKAGTPNWRFAGASGAAPAAAGAAPSGGGLGGLSLGDVKIAGGHVAYSDATTGQTIEAKNVSLDAAMAAVSSPMTLKGSMTLNDEPLTLDASLDSLARLSQGQQAKVKLAVTTKELTAKFDGGAQQRPVPGLDGTFDLSVPSVGRLMAWLHRPLDKAQADPGPVTIHAVFASNGSTSALKEATLQGTALKASASGSLDESGPVTKLSLAVDSSMLDLDRYLPPPPKAAAAAPGIAAPPGKSLAAALSDKPFDLEALRKIDADVKVTLTGVKAMGYVLGNTALSATAKGGVLDAELADLQLYGGSVKGGVKLDATQNALALAASMKIDHVTVDKLAALAGTPASGAVSATLDAAARGTTPRALFAGLSGKLALDLGGVNVKEAAAHAISGLKLEVDLPGLDKQPTLKASLNYNGQAVTTDATLGPLQKMFAGERFPAKIALASALASLNYAGEVQLKQPVPGIDGTFDVDVASVAKLAAWLDNPLDPKQPDPGPLKIHATLASDGAKLTLKDASITGKAIKVTAAMQLDGSQKVPTFTGKLSVQQADLNAYLPSSTGQAAAPGAKGAAPAAAPAAGWSAEPYDLASLADGNGDLTIELASTHYRDLDITEGEIKTTLANKVLTVTIGKLALAKGTIGAKVSLDATGAVPKLAYQATVAGVEAEPLLKTFAGSSRLSGTTDYEMSVAGSGRSEKELVGTLQGKGQFKITNGAIHGIDLPAMLRQAGSLGFGSSETQKTDFSELSGTFAMKAGVLSNGDLKMLAPLVRLTGKGTVPFPPRTLDYTVEATLVASTQGQGGSDSLSGIPIPVKITGPWSNPSYQADWKSVLAQVMKDPARLKNLPANLGNAAKGLGLPIPGGAAGGSQAPAVKNIGNAIKGLFGK